MLQILLERIQCMKGLHSPETFDQNPVKREPLQMTDRDLRVEATLRCGPKVGMFDLIIHSSTWRCSKQGNRQIMFNMWQSLAIGGLEFTSSMCSLTLRRVDLGLLARIKGSPASVRGLLKIVKIISWASGGNVARSKARYSWRTCCRIEQRGD